MSVPIFTLIWLLSGVLSNFDRSPNIVGTSVSPSKQCSVVSIAVHDIFSTSVSFTASLTSGWIAKGANLIAPIRVSCQLFGNTSTNCLHTILVGEQMKHALAKPYKSFSCAVLGNQADGGRNAQACCATESHNANMARHATITGNSVCCMSGRVGVARN